MPGNSIEAKQKMIKTQSSKVFFFTGVFLSDAISRHSGELTSS
jgi:hypothetical protein